MRVRQLWAALVVLSAVAAVAVLLSFREADRDRRAATLTPVVGRPDRGLAPPLTLGRLPVGRGRGTMYDLRRDRGATILLYFREGVGCRACWEQQRLLERPSSRRTLRVDRVVAVIRDPLILTRDAAARRRVTPPLSDEGGSVFVSYGLPDRRRSGHTFVLVGRDGRITRRADFLSRPGASVSRPVTLDELARAIGR